MNYQTHSQRVIDLPQPMKAKRMSAKPEEPECPRCHIEMNYNGCNTHADEYKCPGCNKITMVK